MGGRCCAVQPRLSPLPQTLGRSNENTNHLRSAGRPPTQAFIGIHRDDDGSQCLAVLDATCERGSSALHYDPRSAGLTEAHTIWMGARLRAVQEHPQGAVLQ